uniref:Uncharacterized protein n=1 Tax=Trichuris muris TaxID=70415 RepID=A0A5S6Q665_TRIMR
MSDPNNHEEIWRMVLLSGCIHSAAEKKIEVPQCFSDQYEAMSNKCRSIPTLRELHNDRKMVHFGYLHIRLGCCRNSVGQSFARADNVFQPAAFFPREIFRTCIAKIYKEITDQVQQLIHTFKDIYNQLPQKLPVFVKARGRICENDDDEENFIHQIILPKLGTNIRAYRKPTSEGERKTHESFILAF